MKLIGVERKVFSKRLNVISNAIANVDDLSGWCNRNYIWCVINLAGSRSSCFVLRAIVMTSPWCCSVSSQIAMDTCPAAGGISGTLSTLKGARFPFIFIFLPIWLCKAC